METPRFEAVRGSFPDPYALKKVSPEGVRRRRPSRRSRRRQPASTPSGSPRWPRGSASWSPIPVDPVRLLAARLALDPRRLHPRSSSRPSPSPSSRPIETFAVDPDDAHLRARRAALPDRPLRAWPARADARRQPLGRRRQGDGPRRAATGSAEKLPKVAQRVTPQLLSVYFRYVRNLSLIERRLTPDLYSLVVAAKQTAGDDFALAVAETAREYPYTDDLEPVRAARSGWASTGPRCPVWGVGRWSAGCRARRSRGGRAS